MQRRCFLEMLAAAPCTLAQPPGGRTPVAPFKPGEGANNPIGEGKGIYPGRVVWTRDASATSWDGSTGRWWDDAYSDQKAIARMVSRALHDLTGRKNDKQAWDALFRDFNQTRKLGRLGYRRGEKIAIKLNCNQDRSAQWGVPPPPRPGGRTRPPLNGLPSPHLVTALVAQLIEADVPGEDILLYEVAVGRTIGQPIAARIRANSGRDFQAVRFLVNNDYGHSGRITPVPDKANPIQFATKALSAAYLPEQVTEAKYMINLALLRPHGMAGVTLTAKNHFGSIHFPEGGWLPAPLHSHVLRTQAMGSYNPLVELIGHPHLGGKTMLYMLDGIYSAEHNEGNVFRFASLGDDWASSLLVSQDPVAIDSVGLDILSAEPKATQVRGNADNFLHEAAQAAKPPSGTLYRPAKDTPALACLGVHEHWNNATDRKYSRNLGRKQGIDLIASL